MQFPRESKVSLPLVIYTYTDLYTYTLADTNTRDDSPSSAAAKLSDRRLSAAPVKKKAERGSNGGSAPHVYTHIVKWITSQEFSPTRK